MHGWLSKGLVILLVLNMYTLRDCQLPHVFTLIHFSMRPLSVELFVCLNLSIPKQIILGATYVDIQGIVFFVLVW